MLAQSNVQSSVTSTANSKGYSDDEMHQQQGLDGAERTLLAAEAVSDCNPRTGEETEGATPFKEPSEQREMQTAVLQSEDSVADKRTGLFSRNVYSQS